MQRAWRRGWFHSGLSERVLICSRSVSRRPCSNLHQIGMMSKLATLLARGGRLATARCDAIRDSGCFYRIGHPTKLTRRRTPIRWAISFSFARLAAKKQARGRHPLLAEHFLTLMARKLCRPKPRLTLANAQLLQRYHCPGNVRELQNVIELAVITADGGRLAIEMPSGIVGASKTRVGYQAGDDQHEDMR
jgi:hypothetical protein